MGDEKGKGVLAGGGVLAMLASMMAHGADDCARVGARGATATLGANASRGLTHGAESLGASALRSEGVALSGAHGLEASGARNLEVIGADIAGGQVVEKGLKSGSRAFSGPTPPGYAAPRAHVTAPRPTLVAGKVGPSHSLERVIAEESPGYLLDTIRLGVPDDDDTASPTGLHPGKLYPGRASYFPLHDGAQLAPGARALPLDVLPAPSASEQADATLRRVRFSLAPLILTGWVDEQNRLQLPGTKLAREALFARCRAAHVGCFLVASRGAPSPAGNERMAALWRDAADESLGTLPGGPEVARDLALSLLRSRARLDTDRQITIAHSGLDGPSDASFVWSPPGDAARQP